MASLVKLNPEAHADLKVSGSRAAVSVASQHLMALRVTDIAQAMSDFPIFITRETQTGDLAISALTSFVPGKNMFVENGEWLSAFHSSYMQTYPLFLMKPEKDGDQPDLGLHVESEALGDTGDALFTKSGKPSIWTEQIKAKLLNDAQNTVHTYAFADALKTHDLIRQIDLVLTFQNGQTDRIRGLNVIHEDNLKALPADQLADLRDKGYLASIYIMLSSIFQVNAVIRRHNRLMPDTQISKVNLEVTKL